jgi:hypothetical protein
MKAVSNLVHCHRNSEQVVVQGGGLALGVGLADELASARAYAHNLAQRGATFSPKTTKVPETEPSSAFPQHIIRFTKSEFETSPDI